MKQCYKDCNLITTVRNSHMMYCCCPLWHLPSFNGDKLPEKSSVGSECVAIINLLCLSKHFIMIIRWYLHEDRQRWHMISLHWRGTGCSASSQGRESSWETNWNRSSIRQSLKLRRFCPEQNLFQTFRNGSHVKPFCAASHTPILSSSYYYYFWNFLNPSMIFLDVMEYLVFCYTCLFLF